MNKDCLYIKSKRVYEDRLDLDHFRIDRFENCGKIQSFS